MNKIEDWTDLDSLNFDKPRKKTINGVKVKVSLSPYEKPHAIRALRLESDKKGVIEFKYLGSKENTKLVKVSEHLSFQIGKKSNRLFKIILDLISIEKPEMISLDLIAEKIDEYEHIVDPKDKFSGYDIARKSVKHFQNELIDEFAVSA